MMCSGSLMTTIVLLLLQAFVASVEGTTCTACKTTYTNARNTGGATNTEKCTALKTYLSCLDTSAKGDAGCTLTTAADEINTDYTAIASDCALDPGCTCQKDFWKTGLSNSDAAICTELKKYISCLKTKTGNGCDGTTTVMDLAAAAQTKAGTLSPTCTIDGTCACELTYAKGDISDDTKKCSEVKKYISCLKSKTGNGCDGTTTVVALAEAAQTNAGTLSPTCTIDGTCACELTYAKEDISDDTKKCSATKTYVNCLKDKTAAGCDGTSTKMTLATTAASTISGIGSCSITDTVCFCDVEYAKSDVSDNTKKCTTYKNYISCLIGKTGTGCDESTTLLALASTIDTSITGLGSNCPKTTVCGCEIAYAKADISDNTKKCSMTKTLTTCIQTSIDNGCGATTTKTNVGTLAQAAFTAMATNCAVTETCQCQIDFNKVDVTTAAKCTSAGTLISCLGGITATNEIGCDGSTLTEALMTTYTTSIKTPLCSSGIKLEMSFLVLFLAALVMSL